MSTGAEQIAAERARQVSEEGYTAEHDSGQAHDLIRAARAYAYEARIAVADPEAYRAPVYPMTDEWPWHEHYWKPTGDPVRDLVKAGSLIAAAIDALLADNRSPISETGPS